MVVTAALLETLETARNALEQAGWEVEVVQLQVSRSHPLAGGTALQALNPVWIVTGFLRGEPGKQSPTPLEGTVSPPDKGDLGIWHWQLHLVALPTDAMT